MTAPAGRTHAGVAESPTRSTGRGLPWVLAALFSLLAVLAGCSTGAVGDDDRSEGAAGIEREGDFPRTITHAYGETEITEAPQRVATVSWVHADVSLALGVVPVGMPANAFAANENGSTGAAGAGDRSEGAAGMEREGDFPRTITHAYGETEVTEAPQRVATVSWVNADVSLALGVVPVGMPANAFGANENGSTDWFDAELERIGGEQPEMYSETDGINTEAFAAVEPDIILGAYSGMTQEEYDTLSKIAPTIAMPEGDVPFGTAWQDSTRLIGDALGLSDRAEELVTDVEGQIDQVSADHPDIEGRSFVWGTVDPDAAEKIYAFTDVDNRPRFLEEIGMTQAPAVSEASAGSPDQFAVSWSPERADQLESDILITYATSPEVRDAIESDPLLGRIPAVEAD